MPDGLSKIEKKCALQASRKREEPHESFAINRNKRDACAVFFSLKKSGSMKTSKREQFDGK